jgi:hypothetical protein
VSSKRGRTLAEVMGSLDEETDAPVSSSEEASAVPPSTQPSPAIVPINTMVTPRDRKRLRQLSLDTGLSLQKLGHEAWNSLLKARGLEPLEPVSANVPSGRLRRRIT